MRPRPTLRCPPSRNDFFASVSSALGRRVGENNPIRTASLLPLFLVSEFIIGEPRVTLLEKRNQRIFSTIR